MRIVDLHCDTLLRCFSEDQPLRENSGHIDIEKLKKGGSLAQFFACFIPFEGMDKGGTHYGRYELFQEMYALYRRELEANADVIAEARSLSDIERNAEAGRISAVLTVEDGALIEGEMDRLYELFDKGVRLITLTWNYENCIGYPNSPDDAEHQKGLKPFGIEVVREMDRLGMLIDVSHLSEGGFWDVAKYGSKPFVASHSCARALCGHQRNLTDEQLRCVAEKGGVVGVNFYSEFLRDGCPHSSLDDIMLHIDHMIKVMGEDHVALGSDFDGIDCTLDLEDFGKMGLLADELEKRYGAVTAEKIMSGNALRVIGEVTGTL